MLLFKYGDMGTLFLKTFIELQLVDHMKRKRKNVRNEKETDRERSSNPGSIPTCGSEGV